MFLEQDFIDKFSVPLNLPPNQIVEFYNNFLHEILVFRLDETDKSKVEKYVYRDEERGEFPFGIAFFMFRSGLHSVAIRYLLSSNNDDVQQFGELYRAYFEDYKGSVALENLEDFF